MNRKANLILFLGCVAVLLLFSLFKGNPQTGLDFGKNALTVGCPDYTMSVPYAEIASIELVKVNDFGTAVDGGESKDYRWGIWSNPFWGTYTQCTITATNHCVVLTLDDGERFLLSYEAESTTIDLCRIIFDYLTANGYDVDLLE